MRSARPQSRRSFLKQSCKASLALATPLLGSPWVCGVPLPDDKANDRVRVGILHSLTGFLATIYARVGELDSALPLLEHLLTSPGPAD